MRIGGDGTRVYGQDVGAGDWVMGAYHAPVPRSMDGRAPGVGTTGSERGAPTAGVAGMSALAYLGGGGELDRAGVFDDA